MSLGFRLIIDYLKGNLLVSSMKNTTVFIILFLIICETYSQKSVYVSFPEKEASWDVQINPNPDPLANHDELYFRYILRGDTIINKLSYNKIYKSALQNVPFFVKWPGNYVYACGIRQDSLNKKIYVNLPSENVDTLLYDYNLQLGDTLPDSFVIPKGKYFVVSKIDSINFNGKYFKSFNYLNSNQNEKLWIEGVGSVNGLIEQTLGYPFEAGYVLTDFCNSDFSDCSQKMNLSSGRLISKARKIAIYYNQINYSFSIDESKIPGDLKESFVAVYNILGVNVYNQKITEAKTEIDASQLPKGIYLLKLFVSDEVYSERLIKL